MRLIAIAMMFGLAACNGGGVAGDAPKVDEAAAEAAEPGPHVFPPQGFEEAPPQPSVDDATPADGTAASAPGPGTPDAAARAPADGLVQDGVNYACSVPADCAVKDVGNCCGYAPACVNKDSPTFPEKVKADCAAAGTSSICGFEEISACDCIEGRCAARGAGAVGEVLDAPER